MQKDKELGYVCVCASFSVSAQPGHEVTVLFSAGLSWINVS